MLQIAEIDSGAARTQFRTESLSQIALDLAEIYFGLSLAKSIADLHGARVLLEAGEPGLIAKVIFPSTGPGQHGR